MDAYIKRFKKHEAELKALYMGLYNDEGGYKYLTDNMRIYFDERNDALKSLDNKREKNPSWYKGNDIVGMMLYTDAFAKNLKGVIDKLDYIKACGVNYLHLMPLMDSPKGKDDGGYAVADFRKVKPSLGSLEDLKTLTEKCHNDNISVCLDFVMNHTSDEHEWAKAAREGDPVAKARYYFYDSWDIPNEYEKTMPEVFPTTAPGNFTWLDDIGEIVMTTFYPYQWDLNYANPMVFNDMTLNMLFMANCGIDVIRLDAVPYIWKELYTTCRNHEKVHTLVRMMRIVTEIVCPSVLLLGEVVMEPSKVVPYFGTKDKPECHMLYNVTTMASTWNTIATRDVALLKSQMEKVCALPADYVFLNYLRCHDDIGWGLDYEYLKQFAIEEASHKKYLNDYFTGNIEGSVSRGELYNDDPKLKDARLCGTTASLCGLEAALIERCGNTDEALSCITMLHAYLFTQSGIPVIYSGDEVGQLNDYSYKEDPDRVLDSRYVHRGSFKWDKISEADNVSSAISAAILKLEKLRMKYGVFKSDASVEMIETGSKHVLGIKRMRGSETLTAYFNFSPYRPEIWLPDERTDMKELAGNVKGDKVSAVIPEYGFYMFYAKNRK